jgi:hypothetical protein
VSGGGVGIVDGGGVAGGVAATGCAGGVAAAAGGGVWDWAVEADWQPASTVAAAMRIGITIEFAFIIIDWSGGKGIKAVPRKKSMRPVEFSYSLSALYL